MDTWSKVSLLIIDFLRNILYSRRTLLSLRKTLIYYRFMGKINRIKVVLAEKDKTGKWLANQLGKSTCTVSKWCSNTTQPDLETLDRIAQLLEVDRRELLMPSANN